MAIIIGRLGPEALERVEEIFDVEFGSGIYSLDIWISEEGIHFRTNDGTWNAPLGSVQHRDL